MLAVGRKRTKNLHLPAGVREIKGRWYWQPTSERERLERKAKHLPISVTLGDAKTKAARDRWAEVSGYRDAKDAAGTVSELMTTWKAEALRKMPNGLPRSDGTISQYLACLPALDKQFGACKYGKTEFESSRGEAIGTADIQQWVSTGGRAAENKSLAVLSNAFDYGIRTGKTTYNPCLAVAKNAQEARTREPMEWEVECLRTLASPLVGLLMDYEAITGWRVMDILRLQRAQITADGIRVKHGKRGKRRLWEWTPEFRRIITESAKLPSATPFPASPVFPTIRGKPYTYSGFNRAWQALKALTNAALAECEIRLAIDDLHFHDLRSKAHDDAEDAGIPGHELLGNTKRVAVKHYSRRERRQRPLK